MSREKIERFPAICLDDPALVETADPLRTGLFTSLQTIWHTSSTPLVHGNTKGVEITHRSLVNFALASSSPLHCGRQIEFCNSLPSASIRRRRDLFILIAGATLVLRTAGMLDPASAFLHHAGDGELPSWISDRLLAQLTEDIAADDLELPATLRLVFLAGTRRCPSAPPSGRGHPMDGSGC